MVAGNLVDCEQEIGDGTDDMERGKVSVVPVQWHGPQLSQCSDGQCERVKAG